MKHILLFAFLFFLFQSRAQTVTSYIIVADTSYNYSDLDKKLVKYSNELNLEIDMQNKVYDSKKKSICLPEDDEDELYAGMYYPRRFSSDYLSIEYIQYYENKRNENLMGIILLITGDKKEALKRLSKLSNNIESAHIIKAEIYVGCMH